MIGASLPLMGMRINRQVPTAPQRFTFILKKADDEPRA
jgi:hypothetical protein